MHVILLLRWNAFHRTVPTHMQMKHRRGINVMQAGGKSPSVHPAQEPNPCCRQQVPFLRFNISLGDNMKKVWIFYTRNSNNFLFLPARKQWFVGGKTVLSLGWCCVAAFELAALKNFWLTPNQQVLLLPVQPPPAHPLLPVSSITASPDPVGCVSMATTVVYAPSRYFLAPQMAVWCIINSLPLLHSSLTLVR